MEYPMVFHYCKSFPSNDVGGVGRVVISTVGQRQDLRHLLIAHETTFMRR
jgi:hypothetical protein